MVDARVPPYPIGEKNRIPEAFAHSSSIPSPSDYYDEEPLSVKKETTLPFAPRDSADYEYLERRLREFGSQKAPNVPSPTPTPHPTHITSPIPSPTPSPNVNTLTARGGDNDLISLARAVESNSGCKLAKCVVCEKGLPESFHMQKPVSWLSVCKLAMWALTQDGAAYGRKWFSLGRDICPFVEVHKYVCGREFTPNWKTTIGITMSTYAKRANMFIAGNPNELGLGYYMLPEDATDPYLETAPLIIGRHYRTPNPHTQPVRSNVNNNNTTPHPPSPTSVSANIVNAPSTPPSSTSTPHNVRPATPPRRAPSPSPLVREGTPTRNHRSSTPPPRALTPPPQRTLTPPPTPIHMINNNNYNSNNINNNHSNNTPNPSPSILPSPLSTPREAPSHAMMSSSPASSLSQLHLTSPIPSSRNGRSSPDSEVAAYMNDPACLMGVIRMRRKRFAGEMQRRAIGERKHTTDTERQLLLDYYDKFGTCTTVPEFTDLQHRLGWDAHRTKIWLYNRKTYHHHRPGDKRKKPRTNPSSPTHNAEGTTYEGDSDEEMFDTDEYGNHEDDRDKYDMSEEDQQEYIIELENAVTSLKQRLETEIQAHKADTEKNQANADKIVELQRKTELASTDPNSEVSVLRNQVDLYFNELREEKKKRSQEEMKSLDYMAQINALNLRIATLEKLQSPPSPTSSSGSPTPISTAPSPVPSATSSPASESIASSPASPLPEGTTVDAQGRKVFVTEPAMATNPLIPVPISPSPSSHATL